MAEMPAIVSIMRVNREITLNGIDMRRRKIRRNQVLRLAIIVNLFLW